MPRKANPRAGKATNRTDLLVPKPVVRNPSALQPNGRPIQADVPTGLPYGERGRLTADIRATPTIRTPRPPGRPLPPIPTGVDFTAPGALDDPNAVLGNSTAPQLTPMLSPTERPDEHPMTGAIGRPDSVLGVAAPGSLAGLFSGLAQQTGSAALGALASRAEAAGS